MINASQALTLRSGTALLALALIGGCGRAPLPIENSLGMRFVYVPGGHFLMGSDEAVDRLQGDFPSYSRERLTALTDEAPVHPVRIKRSFYLGQQEVTVGQFRRYLALSGHVPESIADGTGGYATTRLTTRPPRRAATPLKAATPAIPGATQALRRATITRWST